MLLSLSIKNIVLIDSLDLNFRDGFCVLTGETGAGKSILLDALGLSLGKKAEARFVRHGEKQGSATAKFNISKNKEVLKILEEQGIEPEDGNIFLRRIVTSEGKSKAYINGGIVSVNIIQKLAVLLVELHGQHDQRGLLNQSLHCNIIDDYGNFAKKVKKLSESYHLWKSIAVEYEETILKAAKAKEDEEYIRHVIEELNNLAPEVGEEKILSDERALLMSGEKIIESINSAMKEITGKNDVVASLMKAERILQRESDKMPDKFDAALEALDRAGNEINDAIAAIENIASEIDADSGNVDAVEERLFALRAAARKHNRVVDELPEYIKEIEAKLELICSFDDKLIELSAKIKEYKGDYLQLAEALSQERKKSSLKLEKSLKGELTPLKMENTIFKVDFNRVEEKNWSERGIDKISFLVSTNPGNPLSPLGKIASGGELSRFMLAMKVVLSGVKSVPVLIFDEIDTGVGGAVADAIGNRLAKLGEDFQVMCITHQPQVAAYGLQHLKIKKSDKNGKTYTNVAELSDIERREEMARMLSGADITMEARAAASKLLGV